MSLSCDIIETLKKCFNNAQLEMHVNVMSSHNKETTNKYENQIILKYNAEKIAFFEKYKE